MPGQSTAETFPAGNRSLAASFASGFLLTLGDVKAIAFYASLLPVFIDLTTLTVIDMLVLAMITIIGVGSIKLAYAVAASRLAIRANGTALQKVMQRSAGAAMVGAGSWLALKP
jgi:threonine/homoserine/homoserine lactone efflux protein